MSLRWDNKNCSTILIRWISVVAVANFSATSFTLFFSKISSSERLKLNNSFAGFEAKCVKPISVKIDQNRSDVC